MSPRSPRWQENRLFAVLPLMYTLRSPSATPTSNGAVTKPFIMSVLFFIVLRKGLAGFEIIHTENCGPPPPHTHTLPTATDYHGDTDTRWVSPSSQLTVCSLSCFHGVLG